VLGLFDYFGVQAVPGPNFDEEWYKVEDHRPLGQQDSYLVDA
jgi:hypothetical protein